MRFEQVIGYFPKHIIDNVDMMEYLRRGFEKCNARAFNHHAKALGEKAFTVTLNIHGMRRKFSFMKVDNAKLDNDVKATVYGFTVIDENQRNNFKIVSIPSLDFVSFKGVLDNEKVIAITDMSKDRAFDSKVSRKIGGKKREAILESSEIAETRINEDERESYLKALEKLEEEGFTF